MANTNRYCYETGLITTAFHFDSNDKINRVSQFDRMRINTAIAK